MWRAWVVIVMVALAGVFAVVWFGWLAPPSIAP